MKFHKIYPFQVFYHSNPGKIWKIQGLLYKGLVNMDTENTITTVEIGFFV